MNRYPVWLNFLVLAILLAGLLVALPNLYGSVPAVQLAKTDGAPFGDNRFQRIEQALGMADIQAEAMYEQDGRIVVRFASADEQEEAGAILRDRFAADSSVAFTLAPKLPAWIRNLGLNPMSLGLDLRGGVYVLLEVDMDSAINSRLVAYEQDFADRLRDERIRSRVEVDRMTGDRKTRPATGFRRNEKRRARGHAVLEGWLPAKAGTDQALLTGPAIASSAALTTLRDEPTFRRMCPGPPWP